VSGNESEIGSLFSQYWNIKLTCNHVFKQHKNDILNTYKVTKIAKNCSTVLAIESSLSFLKDPYPRTERATKFL
jgi:hypothetical protein